MRVLVGLGLFLLFLVGAVIGLVLGVLLIFWISLIRRKRAVHADGVVCRAEIIARDGHVGARLAGSALVRLSGAFKTQTTSASDVLGLSLRTRTVADAASIDPRIGDQDLEFGTFTSFWTARKDRAATDTGDYLANHYSSVTPWWVPAKGPATLRLVPPPAAPRDRGADRLARLAADLVADRARFGLSVDDVVVAELRLVETLPADASALHISMFRTGRGVRPVGLRNGIRATVYPVSQLGRRIRGG